MPVQQAGGARNRRCSAGVSCGICGNSAVLIVDNLKTGTGISGKSSSSVRLIVLNVSIS